MGEENGVTIGYKEIYKELRGVSESLTKLDSRMERIEEKFGTVKDADERSREALNEAKGAQEDIDELKDEFNSYVKEERKRREQERKRQMEKEQNEKRNKWAVIGVAVTVVIFLLPIIIQYYAKTGG